MAELALLRKWSPSGRSAALSGRAKCGWVRMLAGALLALAAAQM